MAIAAGEEPVGDETQRLDEAQGDPIAQILRRAVQDSARWGLLRLDPGHRGGSSEKRYLEYRLYKQGLAKKQYLKYIFIRIPEDRPMRFTRYTDYALRVLMYLGLKPEDELATIREIAESYDISENHLMKVAHRLGQNGYIVTVRGRQGGLRLAKAPAAINLGDVVRHCEDDLRIVECFDPETNTCPIAGVCALPAGAGWRRWPPSWPCWTVTRWRI